MFTLLRKLFSKKEQVIPRIREEVWETDFTKPKKRRWLPYTGDEQELFFDKDGMHLYTCKSFKSVWQNQPPEYEYKDLIIETVISLRPGAAVEKTAGTVTDNGAPAAAGSCAAGILFRNTGTTYYSVLLSSGGYIRMDAVFNGNPLPLLGWCEVPAFAHATDEPFGSGTAILRIAARETRFLLTVNNTLIAEIDDDTIQSTGAISCILQNWGIVRPAEAVYTAMLIDSRRAVVESVFDRTAALPLNAAQRLNNAESFFSVGRALPALAELRKIPVEETTPESAVLTSLIYQSQHLYREARDCLEQLPGFAETAKTALPLAECYAEVLYLLNDFPRLASFIESLSEQPEPDANNNATDNTAATGESANNDTGTAADNANPEANNNATTNNATTNNDTGTADNNNADTAVTAKSAGNNDTDNTAATGESANNDTGTVADNANPAANNNAATNNDTGSAGNNADTAVTAKSANNNATDNTAATGESANNDTGTAGNSANPAANNNAATNNDTGTADNTNADTAVTTKSPNTNANPTATAKSANNNDTAGNSAVLQNLAGHAAFEMQNWTEAARRYVRAAELEPTQGLFSLNAAKALDKARTAGTTAATEQRIIQLYTTAAEAFLNDENYEDLAAIVPVLQERAADDPRAAAIAGKYFYAAGDTGNAEKNFRQLIETGNADASIWYLSGLLHRSRGEKERGRTELAKAAELEPGYPLFRCRYAESLMIDGDIPAAEAETAAALEQDQTFGWTLNLAASLAHKKNDRETAARYIQKAKEALPAEFSVLENYVHIMAEHHTTEKMLRLLDTAGVFFAEPAADPAAVANPGKAYNLGANLLIAHGDLDAADNWYLQALAHEPENREYLVNRATLCLKMYLYNEADSLLAKAHECGPSPDIYRLIGYLAARKGDFARSEVSYRQGIEDFPDFAGLYYDLTQLYADTGRHEKAAAVLAQLENACPEETDAPEYAELAEKLRNYTHRTLACSSCARQWHIPKNIAPQRPLHLAAEPPNDMPAGMCLECGRSFCIGCAKKSIDKNGRFVCSSCGGRLKLADQGFIWLLRQWMAAAGITED